MRVCVCLWWGGGQVSEVGGGVVMEGFMSEERDFQLDSLWDWESVEVLEDMGDHGRRSG